MANDSLPLPKQCSQCGQEFPRTSEYFPLKKASSDGLRGQCRTCYNAGKVKAYNAKIDHYRAKGREQAAKHSEKAKARNKADYEKNKEKRKTKKREWKLKNKEYISSYSKQFRLDHPELMKQRRKDDHKRNPQNSRMAAIRRRARQRSAEGTFTFDDVLLQGKSQKWLCWWCGKPSGENYHADHRIPLSKGGSNWPENICVACHHCNSSKRDLMPWEFNGRLL